MAGQVVPSALTIMLEDSGRKRAMVPTKSAARMRAMKGCILNLPIASIMKTTPAMRAINGQKSARGIAARIGFIRQTVRFAAKVKRANQDIQGKFPLVAKPFAGEDFPPCCRAYRTIYDMPNIHISLPASYHSTIEK